VIDYIFDDDKEASGLKVYRFRNSFKARKQYRPWGIDPYGNMFYSDADGNIIFIDHETWKLTDIGLNEKEILK